MYRTSKPYQQFGSALLALPLLACVQGVGDDQLSSAPYVERVRLQDKHNTAVRGDQDITVAALDYVADQYEIIGGLSAGDDFIVKSKVVGIDGYHHVRLEQAYGGIPVWGGDIVVHASDEVFKSLNGTLAKQLDGFNTNAEISESEAVITSQADYATLDKNGAGGLEYSRQTIDMVIYPVEERDMRLAWHVTFYTELQAGISPGLWNYFIDAHSGEILHKFNGIHTAVVQASGPGGNAKVPRTWTNFLDVNDLGGGVGRMETDRLLTVDMENKTSGNGTVVEGDIANFGDAAINDAHAFGEVTLNMMLDWYGYNSLDEQGFLIKSRVHYGNNYENAFWDGTQMTYGDGASYFYALSGALDVVAHEFNHGFTSFHSNLTYSGQSGGLNESFSDIAGKLAEFYHEGDGADWDLGRDVFQNANGALRYMCNPPQDGSSIGHADDYTSGMDVHYSSGVSNKAFCRSARRLASGDPDGQATADSVRRAGQAWYLANASYWNSSTDFQQGCQGVMDAANALGFSAAEVADLNQSWQDVGVYCDGAVKPLHCDEKLTADSGTFTSPSFPQPYPNNVNYTWCIEPASGQPATLTFTSFDTEANYDFVEIKDANSNVLSKTSGNQAPADVTSTLIAVTFTSDSSVTKGGFEASWTTGTISNDVPTVQITSPAAGASVSGAVQITADAADSDGTVARVVYSLPNGTTAEATQAPYSISWDSTTASDGPVVISAVAIDDLGASSTPADISLTVANGGSCIDGNFPANDVPQSIPDANTTGINSNLVVAGAGNVETLALSLDITHAYRGDLIVTLTSPSGTQYTVHNGEGSSADDLVISNLAISNFAGESAAGAWILHVHDRYSADVGTLNSWSLTIAGSCTGGGNDAWSGAASPSVATVDNGQVCNTLTVSQSGDAASVLLDLNGTHSWRSVLRGTLEHNGVVVDAFATGTFPTQSGSYGLADQAVAGLSGDAQGDWTLCIIDTDAYGDSGVLSSWSVHN